MNCNICGRELDIIDEHEDYSIIKHPLGYGTKYDGDDLDLHICCDCLEKLIQNCNITPLTALGEEDEE